ncbi:MAG: hypothetical protein H7834_10260 [Magnetococcus sp. YQC-9]
MDLIFNERSLTPLAEGREIARKRVQGFLETVRTAFQKGINRQLRTKDAFLNDMLASGYTWRDWQKDSDVPRELRHYFLGISTRAPFLVGLEALEEKKPEFEFFHKGQPCEGLGAAHLSDHFPVSLLSQKAWDVQLVDLEIRQLRDDGEIDAFMARLPHASRPEHLEFHYKDVIQERLGKTIGTGDDLWNHAGQYFPSLSFCAGVQGQMHNLPHEAIAPILRGLFCLEQFCQEWSTGGFDQNNLSCASSPESRGTKTQYAEERTFPCPDGLTRLFNYHVKLGHSWRIHYDPAPGPGKLYIGYVGRHLRTARYH